MNTKSTIAIGWAVHQKIKKMALLLNVKQGEIVKRGIDLLEQDIQKRDILQKSNEKDNTSNENKINKALAAARSAVLKTDLERKKIREKCRNASIKIDDLIFNDWASGLEEEL